MSKFSTRGNFESQQSVDDNRKQPAKMSASERKFFVGGNWKMNGNCQSIDGIVQFLSAGPLNQDVGKHMQG